MSFPLPYQLGVMRYVLGLPDRYGNHEDTWELDPKPWLVHGYWTPGGEEPWRAGRDLSNVVWSVLAPATPDAPGDRDRIIIGGVEYEIDGKPGDYSHGPWSMPFAGLVYDLKLSEG